ncbi:MAG: hypothetical protein QM763_16095 [Agriterribacter sp.]
MKKICLVLLAFCLTFFSCKKEQEGIIEIRVQNATPLQIEKINISGSDTEMMFDALPAGFTTGYRAAGSLNFSNPQCTIYIQGQQGSFVSSDTSLSHLKPGQYTCRVAYINAVPTIQFTRE